MQRGLLCVREASDARDIEPLIGPVTTQRAEQLSALDAPVMARRCQAQPPIRRVAHIDGAIIAPPNQACAIGTPGRPADPERQLPPDPPPGVCSPLPQQHATPKGSAGQACAIGTPGQTPERGVGLAQAAAEPQRAPPAPAPRPAG